MSSSAKPLRDPNIQWDADFVNELFKNDELFGEVALGAKFLDMQGLMELCCAKIASTMKNKPIEEVCEIWKVPMMTEEDEKLMQEKHPTMFDLKSVDLPVAAPAPAGGAPAAAPAASMIRMPDLTQSDMLVKLLTSDGKEVTVPRHQTQFSRVIQTMLVEDTDDVPVIPLPEVTFRALEEIKKYMAHHSIPGNPENPIEKPLRSNDMYEAIAFGKNNPTVKVDTVAAPPAAMPTAMPVAQEQQDQVMADGNGNGNGGDGDD